MTDKITEERLIKLTGIAHIDFYFCPRQRMARQVELFWKARIPGTRSANCFHHRI